MGYLRFVLAMKGNVTQEEVSVDVSVKKHLRAFQKTDLERVIPPHRYLVCSITPGLNVGVTNEELVGKRQ